jgi:biopolymer transport protein ExbD
MDSGAPTGKAAINVTPLIDIVLVLLIVFIVLVPGPTRALPVAVPQVTQAAPPPEPPVVVTLDPQGRLFLGRVRIDPDRLAEALVPLARAQPPGMRRVFLEVDAEQPWQRVVDVLDRIRLASGRVRRETRAGPGAAGTDGGDIRVAISQIICSAKLKKC